MAVASRDFGRAEQLQRHVAHLKQTRQEVEELTQQRILTRPVAIEIPQGLLGVGVFGSTRRKTGKVTTWYSVEFSHFTDQSNAEEQAAGRLHDGMLLTEVNGVDQRGQQYEQVVASLARRPCRMVFSRNEVTTQLQRTEEEQQLLKMKLQQLLAAADIELPEELQDSEIEEMMTAAYDPQTDIAFPDELRQRFSDANSEGDTLNGEGVRVLGYARILVAVSKKLFKGRWEPQEIIGAGGFGVVVRADDTRLRQQVAIKVAMPSQGRRFGQEEVKRLEREAAAMKRVDHASIVKLHDAFFNDKKEIRILVMEFVSGRSLHEMVQTQGPFSQKKLLEVADALLGALRELHTKNIMHLDIKPANLMCNEESDGSWSIKIIDFGLARAPSTGTEAAATRELTTMMTKNHSVAGTLPFMPPEQLEGGALGFCADVFAAGVTLHYLACGRYPHRVDCQSAVATLRELDSWAEMPPVLLHQRGAVGISEGFGHFVAKAIAVDPDDRFDDAAEMFAALQQLKRTVFISWRMAECKKEVKEQLQPALEALGMKVVVVSELAGGSLLRAVQDGMRDAHMFVIMGTETYGKKTSGKIDTWKEMQDIKESGKPYFLINLNPQASMMRFKEDLANQLFDLDTIAWERWEVGQPMNTKLPGKIMEKLETSCGVVADVLETKRVAPSTGVADWDPAPLRPVANPLVVNGVVLASGQQQVSNPMIPVIRSAARHDRSSSSASAWTTVV
jgi:predicted Ser/Thr protein kinase